jgi:hypothetical protein
VQEGKRKRTSLYRPSSKNYRKPVRSVRSATKVPANLWAAVDVFSTVHDTSAIREQVVEHVAFAKRVQKIRLRLVRYKLEEVEA